MSDVAVLLSDLEHLRGLLGTLYNQHEAEDLVDQYRKLAHVARRSPLTIAIADGLAKIEAYIEAAEAEADDGER